MSVTGTNNTISYATDGTTTKFFYPDYLFQFSDMVVSYTPAGSTITEALGLGSDYTLSGVADTFGAYPGGVELTTIFQGGVTATPLPSGGSLVLTRATQETQLIQYIDGDKFPAMSHEHGLDKLTLMIQDCCKGFLGFFGAPPPGPASNGQWFIVYPAVAGTFFGYIYTTTGWKQFAPISF
jgi:hypothetical protein